MPPRNHRTKKARTKTKRKRGRARDRPGRLRRYAGITLALVVAGLGVLLYLDVTVTSRFDGRLWQLPSRIYSDTLDLVPGSFLSTRDLKQRLARCGYAEVAERPGRPGQYRVLGSRVEVYVRPFSTPETSAEAGLLKLRFASDRVLSIRDGEGRGLPRAELEPELLATLFGSRQEERHLVRLSQTPETFIRAVLAAEDARFYEHRGIDLRGMLRAGWVNLRRLRITQGGSTITQQTVKNLYLGQQRTLWRKLRELPMSLILDARYDKGRILEVYLNEVYLGQRGAVAICGAKAAARFYFGRNLADLSLGEWALLAGMIRSPGHYNPFAHPERALARRDQVLDAMERLGFAESERIAAAHAEGLELASGAGGFSGAAYVVDFVRHQLARRYSSRVLREDGLSIYTTLDTRIQRHAETALVEGLARLERDAQGVRRQLNERQLQGAVVVTRPDNGQILAMVGGRDYGETQFNRAVQAHRQPGSCFKPFVYAAGFERSAREAGVGLTPATLLEDAPLEMRSGGSSWRPSNYDRRHRGWVTARQALEQSLNVPTVRAALSVGLDRVVDAAHRCGIRSPMAELPSLALGTEEVTPLELAAAYGTLAQRGSRSDPWIVRSVTDGAGKLLEGRGPRRQRALDPQAAYLVTDILHGVFVNGTARSAAELGFHGRAAGKTGTTDDTRDSWFVGYTPELLALVWVGFDDAAPTGLTGATGALPIWVDLMRRSVRTGARSGLDEPPDIVRALIDPLSGLLARPQCPNVVEERFARGTEPRARCDLHRGKLQRWWNRWRERSRHPGTV